MSNIHVSYDTQFPEQWKVERPYERQTALGPIVVPQDFMTDLASVPRQVWLRFPRWGPWSGAAIVHDWLYRTKPAGIDRLSADRVFRELMKQDGVAWGDYRMIYRAVRDFGDAAWNGTEIAA